MKPVYQHPDGHTIVYDDNTLTTTDSDGKSVSIPIGTYGLMPLCNELESVADCTKDNGPDAPHDRPAKKAINDLNFATGDRPRKSIATQVAELAIRGHAVHHLADGGYLVCKYGYTHHAPDFAALQAFARRLGVSQ